VSAKATFWAWAQALPATQKLVLVALAHRHNPDTGRCDPSVAKMASDCGLGRTAVKDALKALGEKGLIRAINRQFGDVFASNAYEFIWSAGVTPDWDEPQGGRSPDDQGGVENLRVGVGRQTTGVGRVATGGRSPDDHELKREPEIEPEKTLFGADAPPCASKQKATEGTEKAFDEFWSVYPRTVEKKAARAKFDLAVKGGADPARIVAAARLYASKVKAERIEERFVKHPTTWLNKGCWDDEAAAAPSPQVAVADLLRDADMAEAVGHVLRAQSLRDQARKLQSGAA